MPKYEIGPKVMKLGLALIIAAVVIALVALDAKDVLFKAADIVTGMEGAS